MRANSAAKPLRAFTWEWSGRAPTGSFPCATTASVFDPAYSERIFRPFERLNGRQYPGSGLGLSLAKRIIEQHGGNIWAESRPGEGATFRFSLPVAG